MTTFNGIWVPMITPFAHGDVDFISAQRLAQNLIDQGVDGIVVAATTGEASTLTTEEQDTLLDAILEVCAGQCPVVLGITGNDTTQLAERITAHNSSDISGFLVSAPYYNRPSQEGIFQHFRALANVTDQPFIIYNIPYRTGVNIEISTVQRLCANPQFVAIKESGGGNITQLSRLIQETELNVLSGEDSLIFITACLGGQGAISAAAHLRPDLFQRMLQHVKAGEMELARQLHYTLEPVIRLLFSEPNPAPLKAALAMLGLIEDELRLPMTPATVPCRRELEVVMAELMAIA